MVPRGASGEVREYTLTAGQLSGLRTGVIVTAGVILALGLAAAGVTRLRERGRRAPPDEDDDGEG